MFMDNNDEREMSRPFSTIAHFAAHSIVGSLVFVIIAIPAFGLGLLVNWLETQGASSYVLAVLTYLEYAIVTIDALAFFWHLVYTAYKASRGK
jgi:cytochrome b561